MEYLSEEDEQFVAEDFSGPPGGNWHEHRRRVSLECFRTVNGLGDAGSEHEFNCRRIGEQGGWMRMGARIIKLQNNQKPMNKDQLYMVFDVESVGLHGLDFAVGWVVVNSKGVEISDALMCCERNETFGTPEAIKWCNENIPPMAITHSCPKDMREAFWSQWLCWKERGALLVADCAWPVEARFLTACVDEHQEQREWQGPYPLHDVASIALALGRNPLATNPRISPHELPVHNPNADARQSARILIELLHPK